MARPAEWTSPTKMIRLPQAHEDQLKAIAHRIEAGDRIITASQLEATVRGILQSTRPRDRLSLCRAYDRLLSRIAEAQAEE